jgi:hypothetical protein
MTNKIAVFYFSSIPYDFLYQRPQQLFREWRSHFEESYTFYYVNPQDLFRFAIFTLQEGKRALRRRIFNKREAVDDDARILTWIPLPFILPGHGLPVIQNFPLRTFDYRKTLEKCCGKTQKKVAIVADLMREPYITKAEFDVICYDYLDTVNIPANTYKLREKHERLIVKSDIVFVTAEKLKEEVLSIAKDKDVVTISNGVDANFFENKRRLREVTDYHRRNSKIVGYIGALYSWVNIDLIYATARRLNRVDFLLVGPFAKDTKRFIDNKPENVFILGAKEYSKIPAYIDMLDAGLIPFKPGPISESADPIKLYEFFSLGKPVVATCLRQLKRFDNGSLLRIAETTDEFVEAITFFLEHDAEQWQESRKQIARQNSWHSKASAMMNCIQSGIGERS